ncbi:putative apoptosis-inducing factor 1, mitochondrial isoform X1 [Drosophila gunungcola]|uniref:putative apoptosis-inducing factor 1, mitochondrial isoform X1 n=1 Tax=Drosophila gunungcola TaxID=103775 RepID=UPI0022E2C7B3|nr:putative apoptosis-inducing factor 1, mitochondrial isoform X1 [Drosophila gunungcola]
MSIWGVRCLAQKFIRQAYILANRRILASVPQRSPPAYAILRPAHSSLYQMVKKRTLEARTKLQANKYPNHQACVVKPSATPPNQEGEEAFVEATGVSSFANSQFQAPSAQSEPLFKVGFAESKTVCSPKDVLKSDSAKLSTSQPVLDSCKPTNACEEFQRKRKETKCQPCNEDGTAPGGSGGGDEDCECRMRDFRIKCLLGALAALLSGGLLTWFLTRDTDDSEARKAQEEEEERKRRLIAGLATSPPTSEDLPKHVPYLIVGGGTAAFSAFRAIKSNDAKAKVLMISNEFRKPYMRPPLSKELWYTPNPNEDPIKDYRFKQWTGSERSLFFEPDEFFVDPENLEDSANGGIAVAQGFAVKKIDAQKRIVTLNDGYEIGYDECLIATGCAPKNLTMLRDAPPSVLEKVMVYRTPDDFDRLRRLAAEKRSITIVGNGFIGSELACSLAHYSRENNGGKVYQVFQENANMSKVLPNYLSRWTTAKMEAQGVCVIPNASIRSAVRDEANLKLELNNGMTLMSDVVVVCVGCTPNTELAGPSRLEVDRSLGGFVVNAELEARRNLYVAGDASCFFDPLLGRRRVEHHDHSVVSGRLAGENMTGAKKPYQHQSMFWSDLGPEIGYEGIGLVDSSLPTVGVFALPSDSANRVDQLSESSGDGSISASSSESTKSDAVVSPDGVTCDPDEANNYGKGVIFYLKNDKIVGILLWNLFNRIGLARTIINQNKKYDDLNEVAKLFEIHA